MSEITVWGLAIMIFLAMQCVILFSEIVRLSDKINDLKFKLDYKLASTAGAEGSKE